MAEGVNYAKMATPTPANRLKPGEFDGRVKVMTDTVELATEAAGTVKMCGTLPKGAIVLGVYLTCDALGDTITVGDALVAARYHTAITTAEKFMEPGNVVAGINYEVLMAVAATLDNQIIVTLAGECDGTLKLTVLYAHD